MGSPVQRPVEVFRVNPITFWVTIVGAVLLQTYLPLKVDLAKHFDFLLLATIYFSLLRRNKVFGIGMGTVLGLLQDALSHRFIGIHGMPKALVGYLAASASIKFALDPLLARLTLAGIFVLVHDLFLAGIEHALLEVPQPLYALNLVISLLVNVALGLILFQLLDRFKQPS